MAACPACGSANPDGAYAIGIRRARAFLVALDAAPGTELAWR